MKKFIERIDHIIELVNSDQPGKEDLLEKVIEPLFNELQPVVDDFLDVFFTAEEVAAANEDWEKSISIIKEHREDLLTAREKIRELAIQLRKFRSEEVDNFTFSIYNFFYSTRFASRKIPTENMLLSGSETVYLQNLFDHVERSGSNEADLLTSTNYSLSRKDLLVYIRESLSILEQGWEDVTKDYAKLKSKL